MVRIVVIAIFSGIVSIVGTLYAISWQEEALIFQLDAPAKFGDTFYQNIRIQNKGWEPAINVIVALHEHDINDKQMVVQSFPTFDLAVEKGGQLGAYTRVRRNETVTVTLLSRDKPITPELIEIKSDRSIASYSNDQKWFFDFFSFTIGLTTWVAFMIIFSLSFSRQFQAYKKKAEKAASEAKLRNMLTEEVQENSNLRQEIETLKKEKEQ